MNVLLTPIFRRGIAHGQHLRWIRSILCLVTMLLVLPALAEAQFINSPFDTGLTALQSLFTGTVAKVASLIAIVIGGYEFAHGEPGAKKVAASTTGGSPHGLLSRGICERRQTPAHSASRQAIAGVD